MAAAPFYDRRPVCRRAKCPRCQHPVQVSRCHTAARELCGHCGNEWAPASRIERAEVR
ncbi:hypothetical protein [Streptomyces violascens]|uniref:hypothetical protein n=1 Tax=Streptomyces violascens TaxID=67381 RepID=UPI00368FFE1C